ncbi:MAG: carboxypeptidase regulatory-like domain-containing protein [Candidatus Riflebacteria bacterium]|nr:carboxypeptidase regulatory-like domain-containing protein [Candidatus Riflebacteria bacterium]
MRAKTTVLLSLIALLFMIMLGCSSGGDGPARGVWIGMPNATLPAGFSTMAGMIVDSNGLPAQNVAVNLLSGSLLIASTTTDVDGRYQLVAQTGTYTVSVVKDGYATVEQSVSLVADEIAAFNTVISSTIGIISGEITSQKTGEYLAGVSLKVESVTTPLLEINPIITEATGTYRFTLPPGSYKLTATLSGYASQSVDITLAALQTVKQNFALSRTSSVVFGRITDQAQNPQKDAFVRFVSADGTKPGAEVTTGDNGQYSFNLMAGTFNITVIKSGFNKHESSVAVVVDTEINRDIELIPPSTPVNLIGTVLLNTTDEPLANIPVNLVRDGELLASSLTTSEGKFIFQEYTAGMYYIGLADNSVSYNPATYVVHILNDGTLSPEAPNLYLSAKIMGEDDSLVYHKLATGTVYDMFTKAPMQYVTCSIKGVGSTVTDLKGYFEFKNLLPGSYELSLARNGWSTLTTNFTVRITAADPTKTEILPADLTFTMSQSPEIDRGSVAGRYVDETTGAGENDLIVRIYTFREVTKTITIGGVDKEVTEWTLFSPTPGSVVSTKTGNGALDFDTAGSFRLEHIEPSTLPKENPADEIAGYLVYVGDGYSTLSTVASSWNGNGYDWWLPDPNTVGVKHIWSYVKVKPNTTTYLHNYDQPNE